MHEGLNLDQPGSHHVRFNWFVAQLKPNQLLIARRNLARQGIDCFMPEITKVSASSKGIAQLRRPLFPGYLFVALDLKSSTWAKVGNTRGISRLISFGSKLPHPLPHGFIEALKLRVGPDGMLNPEPDVKIGSVVRITSGPFSNFIGRVEKLDDDQRAWFLLDFLGQQSRVGIEIRNLEMLHKEQ